MNKELVVVTKGDVGLRALRGGVTSTQDHNVEDINKILKKHNTNLTPLFGMSEDRIQKKMEEIPGLNPKLQPDLSTYYCVNIPEKNFDSVIKDLNSLNIIEGAYLKPESTIPAIDLLNQKGINGMTPSSEDAPIESTDFTNRQIYLNPAPEGIDAKYAWTFPGGQGENIKIIDCEWGWNFTHEDLIKNQWGVAIGVNSINENFVNHGTAVIGQIGGDLNQFGVIQQLTKI